jgi:DNA replication protein DnaC
MSAPTDPTVMLLRSFFLTTMAGQYEEVMQRAEKEGWSHRQVLRHLCESEAIERGQKRTARLLAESGLPVGKTLSSLDEALLPPKVRRQLASLIEGSFVERSVNVLAFGLPGRGKTHFLAALVFSQWDQIFKDPMTTMAAIDRLVHNSIILEFDGASQRVKKAAEKVSPPKPG